MIKTYNHKEQLEGIAVESVPVASLFKISDLGDVANSIILLRLAPRSIKQITEYYALKVDGHGWYQNIEYTDKPFVKEGYEPEPAYAVNVLSGELYVVPAGTKIVPLKGSLETEVDAVALRGAVQ